MYANCVENSTRFFLPGDHLRTDCLLSSLRVDLQVYNFKKEDTFSYNMQVTDFKDLPQSSQNLSLGKILQVYNFKKEDTFSYNVQIMDLKDLPRSSRNLDRKMTLYGMCLF
jgi:hypothetical protein